MSDVMIPGPVLEQVARRFRLLGDPVRLRILNYLHTCQEASVQQIVDATSQSQANVSKHLRALSSESLVDKRKEGLFVYYRVNDPTLPALCMLVCGRLESIPGT
ncbi:ArsR/SmtB family transcription factor [Bacteroidota bacterium]